MKLELESEWESEHGAPSTGYGARSTESGEQRPEQGIGVEIGVGVGVGVGIGARSTESDSDKDSKSGLKVLLESQVLKKWESRPEPET